MAKRRKKKNSSKCPEPINTLIDLAAGLTMGAIADHMEKKYHYKKKGKINPYTVSAFGLASGRMKSTEDILRTGAFLGAMGSFDVDTSDPDAPRSYIVDDPIFHDIPEAKVNDNRYAWRLNCVDGSAYGISPYDYETRDAYNAAISRVKATMQDSTETSSTELPPEDAMPEEDAPEQSQPTEIYKASCSDPFANDDFHVYTYCRVKLVDSEMIAYYRTEDQTLKKGEVVIIPASDTMRNMQGIILSVERHMRFSVPQPVEQTLEIIGRAT